jgi:KUP system potassium uptake protein
MRESLPFNRISNAFYDFTEEAAKDPAELMKWRLGLQPLKEPLVSVDEQDDLLEPVNFIKDLVEMPEQTSDRVLRSSRRTSEGAASATEADSYADFLDIYGAFMFESFTAQSAKITVGHALKGRDRARWMEAIVAEIKLLLDGGTLVPVDEEEIVGPHQLIHSTMQLKLKLHADGSVDKYKARLCACGNELYGLVAETFAPTISHLAYATVHQLAIIDRMHKITVDTVGAYLHQFYPADAIPLYLVLPPNVAVAIGAEPGLKYRIRKYLYGLPDAGLAYYKAYSEHLIAKGYLRSISDPCLFFKLEGNTRTYVWTHVDDTFVCSTHKHLLDLFVDKMKEKFDVTVVHNVEEYLGIHMESMPNGDVKLTQPKLLESLLDEYRDKLGEVSKYRNRAPQRETAPLEESIAIPQAEYLHLLGALIYLCKSRPDISTAVSFASTYAAAPTEAAFVELIYILQYLKGTQSHGLILRSGEPNRELTLTCYVDASYLTHRDSKSHTGYTLSFGEMNTNYRVEGTFYSKSSKQTLVTTSSTHAEMRAMFSLIVDIVYVVHLCAEIGRPVKLPAIVMEDNQPVIDVTSDVSSRTKRCKHFLMLVNYVREQVVTGLIQIRKVATVENLADVLTKIVTGGEFQTKAGLLLGLPVSPVIVDEDSADGEQAIAAT